MATKHELWMSCPEVREAEREAIEEERHAIDALKADQQALAAGIKTGRAEIKADKVHKLLDVILRTPKVMSRILFHCQPESTETLFNMCHVAIMWRSLLSSSPTLWTHFDSGCIDLKSPGGKDKLQSLFTGIGYCLRGAQPCCVDLRIDMKNLDSDGSGRIMRFLMSHASQWSSIYWRMDKSMEIKISGGELPNLKYFYFHSAHCSTITGCSFRADRLRELDLGPVNVPPGFLPWKQLTTITLQQSVRQCLSILQLTSNVVTLSFSCPLAPGATVEKTDTRFHVPLLKLRKFTLGGWPSPQLIAHLVLPELQQLEIGSELNNWASQMKSLSKRSKCRPTDFSFRLRMPDEVDLRHLLHLSSVQHLVLDVKGVTCASMAAFLYALSFRQFLPRLESMHIPNCTDKVDLPVLVKMLQERTTATGSAVLRSCKLGFQRDEQYGDVHIPTEGDDTGEVRLALDELEHLRAGDLILNNKYRLSELAREVLEKSLKPRIEHLLRGDPGSGAGDACMREDRRETSSPFSAFSGRLAVGTRETAIEDPTSNLCDRRHISSKSSDLDVVPLELCWGNLEDSEGRTESIHGTVPIGTPGSRKSPDVHPLHTKSMVHHRP
ncbi:hypothetical protein FB45DRAFT_861093 [Roridomyces roridus]|uniref:F-box domain-containing protein n=1 Tax=Roridomyces roridus TaxID=1738132 RepID=A0AAD7CGU6_9AGAR|nr:hypothetical protein FB45DRAFT_861093 [Roridomyces roridus]